MEDIGDNGRFDFSSKNILVCLPRSESLDILSDGCESDVDQFLGCQIDDNEIRTIDRCIISRFIIRRRAA
jgi:hypothetical protein